MVTGPAHAARGVVVRACGVYGYVRASVPLGEFPKIRDPNVRTSNIAYRGSVGLVCTLWGFRASVNG